MKTILLLTAVVLTGCAAQPVQLFREPSPDHVALAKRLCGGELKQVDVRRSLVPKGSDSKGGAMVTAVCTDDTVHFSYLDNQ